MTDSRLDTNWRQPNSIGSEVSECFLSLSSSERYSILQQLGLLRYAEFLTQMPDTVANQTCVSRFLLFPEQVKFPQLQGAELSGLVLPECNLIRANLMEATLQKTDLRQGDLLFVRAIGADFRGANLRGATLSHTVWTAAQVEGCQFGTGDGLTKAQICDLHDRGALFDQLM